MKANSNKVIVHLYGGVGNQLFQYTFGEYIRNKYGLNVYYDVSSFGILETYRDYQLNVITESLPIYKANRLFFSRYNKYTRFVLRAIYKKLPGVKYICDYEDEFTEDSLNNSKYKTYYFDGYWHNKKYAEWLYGQKSEIFSPVVETPDVLNEYLSFITDNDVISLHVRRGDYLKPENKNMMGACSNDYYKKAVELLLEKYPNSNLLVFSDDTAWVEANLHFNIPMKVVKNYDIQPYWYIMLMSKCRHYIISNSTFSWWGAFLNTNPNKTVVIPSKWYSDRNNPDIYFKNWIKV